MFLSFSIALQIVMYWQAWKHTDVKRVLREKMKKQSDELVLSKKGSMYFTQVFFKYKAVKY